MRRLFALRPLISMALDLELVVHEVCKNHLRYFLIDFRARNVYFISL